MAKVLGGEMVKVAVANCNAMRSDANVRLEESRNSRNRAVKPRKGAREIFGIVSKLSILRLYIELCGAAIVRRLVS